MKMPKIIQFIVLSLLAYLFFKAPGFLLGKPIPESLIFMYMFFVVITILLVMTSTEKGTKELFSPIRALVEDPSKRLIRNVVFAVLPLIAIYFTYNAVKPSLEPPVELRATHPAPPATIKAYDKTFDLATLENPYRRLEKEDPAQFRQFVGEGGVIYFRNCFYCHGDKLDGKGHYAQGLNPLPLPFQGKDTIAQLQESYVFWRVVKGGPGLPKEGSPAISSMPAWENMLTEDEVWKAILFIYDYTGNVPRSWGKK
ncbi:MAG: cytochrome c [Deltaproteobacteria bacterium]|nr:cytochrome c [Deltaproteobacteria bacterium]